jgi:hypothetical protein
MMLPVNIATPMRNFFTGDNIQANPQAFSGGSAGGGSGSGAGGGDTHIHLAVNLSAIDTHTGTKFLLDNMPRIAAGLKNQWRIGNPSLRSSMNF